LHKLAVSTSGARGLALDSPHSTVQVAATLDKPFRALSGGMKHKLLLAIAFATSADLYILDEPTASLDTEARERFVELLDEAAKDATVIICSHRLDEIAGLVGRSHGLVGGNEGQHLKEINNLNHYIGMRAIDERDLTDCSWPRSMARLTGRWSCRRSTRRRPVAGARRRSAWRAAASARPGRRAADRAGAR
jgi:ABC-type Na+ transport system ATPase subunit NatA